MLALPGSAYLYQGEELGLQEVADIPRRRAQDPTFFRTKGVRSAATAAACRCPGPRGRLVRLRRRRGAPAAAGLVQPLRGRRPGRGGRFDARALPARP